MIAAYHRGVSAPEPARAKRGMRASAALRRDEVLVLQFLHEELAKEG